MEDLLHKIDWNLLREQKAALYALADIEDEYSPEEYEHLHGLIELVGQLQDLAVRDLGLSEDAVFDLT